jgi:hypothetical protein
MPCYPFLTLTNLRAEFMNLFLTLLAFGISLSFAQENYCGSELVGKFHKCTTVTSIEADVLKADSVQISQEISTQGRKLLFSSHLEGEDYTVSAPIDLLNDLNYPLDRRTPCNRNFIALVAKNNTNLKFTLAVSGQDPHKLLTGVLNSPDIQATLTCQQK